MSSSERSAASLRRQTTPRNHDATAIAEIGRPTINTHHIDNDMVNYSSLLGLYSAVKNNGNSPVHAALGEVICRLIEVGLLRDVEFEKLTSRWGMLSVRAPDIISRRIVELTGVTPSDETVQHFFNIMGGSAAQRGRRSIAYEEYLPNVFKRHAESHARQELRCAVCGYHFQERDLNPRRKLWAEDFELVLASNTHPSRALDVFKPEYVQVPAGEGKFKPKSVTGLTIDHVIPEEGLGWSGPNNLEVLCGFCNVGKLAYRWALEPVSLFGAGGFADFPVGRPLNKLAQTAVVSALRYSGGRCHDCGKTIQDAEITAKPKQKMADEKVRGFAPWNLDVLCYDCIKP